MAKIIIQLDKSSSMADVDQLLKEIRRKKYVLAAWHLTEKQYAETHGIQLCIKCEERPAMVGNIYCSVCIP